MEYSHIFGVRRVHQIYCTLDGKCTLPVKCLKRYKIYVIDG